MNSSIQLVLFLFFVLVSDITGAARSGAICNSNYGSGSCQPISQCSQLARMRMSGKTPVMCGFDQNGPVVCCPKVFPIREGSKIRPSQSRPFFNFELSDDPFSSGDSKKQNNLFYDPPALARPDLDFNNNNNNNNNWGDSRLPLGPQSSDTYFNGQEVTPRPSLHEKPSENAWRPEFNGASFGQSSFSSVSSNRPQFPDLTPDGWGSSNSNNNFNNYNNNNNNNNNINRPQSSGSFDSGLRRTSTTTTEKPFIWSNPNRNTTPKQENKVYTNTGSPRISSIECNKYKQKLSSPSCSGPIQLIVGGQNAEFGEFPHMVALGYRTYSGIDWSCGGTLISRDFVLTAAHCLITSQGKPVKVRMGVVNLEAFDTRMQDIEVERVLVHPRYNKEKKYYDLGLVELSRSAHFSENVRPACLAQPDDVTARAVATGWGRRGLALQTVHDRLQKVEMSVIDNTRCQKLFRNFTDLPQGIVNAMVCAGDEGRDTCQGDSGGPLQFINGDNRCVYHIFGVTSFGMNGCGKLGVYSRVSSYLSWIEKEVWPEYYDEY